MLKNGHNLFFFMHQKCVLALLCIYLSVFGLTQSIYAQSNDTINQVNKFDSISLDSNTVNQVNHVKLNHKKVDSLLMYAYSFIGKKYKRGGTTMNGFDCSGYTMIVFSKFGIRLPHTSSGQSLLGIEIKKTQIDKGNLVFFKGRNIRSKRIGHVGIVITHKGEPVQFIHSSTTMGVKIDRLESPYYKKRFVKATRIPL